jgi:flagellar assembly factor FliW
MSAGVLAAPAPAVAALQLTEPLPGFPDHRDYALVAADGSGLVFWLQALDPEGPRFLAVPAGPYFPEYAPVLPGTVPVELGLEEQATPMLYCLVTVPGGDIEKATANLRAPLAVNPAAGRARQVVLSDGTHPIRRPLRR